MISEGGCDCSNEAVLMSPDQDTFSIRVAAQSALVNELVLAPSPRCIRFAISFFLQFVLFKFWAWYNFSGCFSTILYTG